MATATVKRPDPVVPTATDRLAEARATKAKTSAAKTDAHTRRERLLRTLQGIDGQKEVTLQGRAYGAVAGPASEHRMSVPVPVDTSPEALALARLDLPDAERAVLLTVLADQQADAALREAIRADRAERVARLTPVVRDATVEFYDRLDRFIRTEYAAFVKVLDAVETDLGDDTLTSQYRWPEFETDAGSLISFRRRMLGLT